MRAHGEPLRARDSGRAAAARTDPRARRAAERIESLKRELLYKSTRIEQLSYELARYKRLRFARSSEALHGVQASLLQEALDCDLAAIEEQLEQLRARPKSAATQRPRREALPAHL